MKSPSPVPGSRTAVLGWALYAALFAGSRLAIVALLYIVTGGREFTDDVHLWHAFLNFPLESFYGDFTKVSPSVAHHPPLIALFFLPFKPLVTVLGTFVGFRLVFIIFEMLTVALCLVAVPARRGATAVLLLLNPAGWMTTAVFAQEEFLTALLVGLAVIAAMSTRLSDFSRAVFLALPILAGKLFSGFLLLMLVPWLAARSRRTLYLAAALTGAILTSWATAHLLTHGSLPLVSSLAASYEAQSPLAMLNACWGVPAHLMRLGTIVLIAAIIGIPLVHGRHTLSTDSLFAMSCVAWAGMVYVLLSYHTYPEYITWATLPFALTAAAFRRSRASLAWTGWFLTSFAGWGANIATGLARAQDSGDPAKTKMLDVYVSLFCKSSLDPLLVALMIAYALGLLMLATLVTSTFTLDTREQSRP